MLFWPVWSLRDPVCPSTGSRVKEIRDLLHCHWTKVEKVYDTEVFGHRETSGRSRGIPRRGPWNQRGYLSFEVLWGATVRVQGPETHALRQEKVKSHGECGRAGDSQG